MKSMLGWNNHLENPSDALHRRPKLQVYYISEELPRVTVNYEARNVYAIWVLPVICFTEGLSGGGPHSSA
jgi:hypothetical protein